MFLQWFPGHMTRALRMMEEQVKLCDGIVYVLDARAPFACLNKKLDSIFLNRPIVYLLNKADLVNDFELKKVVSEFESLNKKVISVVGISEKSIKTLYDAIYSSLSETVEKYRKKSIKRPLRIMVAGIPNTGKSTIINLICGGKKARTGDKAGVTKDKQWIKVKDLEFLDTPGTTPPSFETQKLAEYLAIIGSINDDILDFQELSYILIKYLQSNYPKAIETAYGIDTVDKTEQEIFSLIAKKRGALKKGGDIDEERCGSIIISDLRKGKLGKIMFL